MWISNIDLTTKYREVFQCLAKKGTCWSSRWVKNMARPEKDSLAIINNQFERVWIIRILQVIYKTLLGKVPPYLSSLVTIAAPTCSTRSSRYISLVIPKTNFSFGRLSFQFSAANDWNKLQKSLKLETLISLTSFKHQLSEQLPDYCTCT